MRNFVRGQVQTISLIRLGRDFNGGHAPVARRGFLPFCFVGVIGLSCQSFESAPPPRRIASRATSEIAITRTAPSVRANRQPPVQSNWCLAGLISLDEATCYIEPATKPEHPELLIYLHGVISPTGGPEQRNVQDVVERHVKWNGYYGLLPRGRRGLGPAPVRDWWSWPTTQAAYAKLAPELIREWFDRKATLESLLGVHFEKTFLAGSSNGAYFLTMIALHGDVQADGFGAMSGGAPGHSAQSKTESGSSRSSHIRRPPFYVGFGAYDDTNQGPEALGDWLAKSGWPSLTRVHKTGHGARQIYLDEAFVFWHHE